MTRQTITQTQQQTLTISPLSTGGILQRKCESCGQHTIAGGECAECAKKKSGLQRKLTIGASNDPLEQEADWVADQVMAAPAHSVIGNAPLRMQCCTEQRAEGGGSAPASVDRVLSSPGRPLDPELQQDMEHRFRHDFSRVRVHTDAAAERSAQEVNANAYTVRNNIVFGSGQFAPWTNKGKWLIAHELTHTIQQSTSRNLDTTVKRERLSTVDSGVVQRDEQSKTVQSPLSTTSTVTSSDQTPPFYGLKAASDAIHGIELHYNVKALPFVDASIKPINAGPYRVIPYVRRNPDGTSSLLYYSAYRKEPGLIGPTNWDEYAIGPDSIEKFLSNVQGYAAGGAFAYMFGPPAPNAVEGARFVNSIMSGQFGDAAKAYGSSLWESIKDPGWWVQMLTASAGLFKGPVVSSGPPRLTLIRGGGSPGGVVGRVGGSPGAVVGRVGGSGYPTVGTGALQAVQDLAPAQPASPLLRAVPAPAPAPAAPAPVTPVTTGLKIPLEVVTSVTSVLASQGLKPKSQPQTNSQTKPDPCADCSDDNWRKYNLTFMQEKLERILSNPNHPLGFLVDYQTGTWKSRSNKNEAGVHAGHRFNKLACQQGWGKLSLAVEEGWQNIYDSSTDKVLAVSKGTVIIEGVEVDYGSALQWKKQGELKNINLDSLKIYDEGWKPSVCR